MRTAAPLLLGFILLLACGVIIAPVDARLLQDLHRNNTTVGLDGSPTPNSTADRQAEEATEERQPRAPVASSVDNPEWNDRRISKLEAHQANIDTQLVEMRAGFLADLKVDMARERDRWQATHAQETRELRLLIVDECPGHGGAQQGRTLRLPHSDSSRQHCSDR